MILHSFLLVARCFLSCEGTTQGDPLAMAMYGLAVLPLINASPTKTSKSGTPMMLLVVDASGM